MDKWDEFAIITFITCDAILENIYEIRNLYIYYYRDIKKRLRDRQQNIYMIIYEEKHKNNNRYKMINIKKNNLGKYKQYRNFYSRQSKSEYKN